MSRGASRFLALLALLAGCGDATDAAGPSAAAPVTATSAPGTLEGEPVCDAGDATFARRVVPHLYGRKAYSVREVALLTSVAKQLGREGLVRAMMRSPEFVAYWQHVLKDLLYSNRAGARSNTDCGVAPALPTPSADLATHIREHAPDGPEFPSPWNLRDLVTSTLLLDDLSPLFRAHLFLQAGSQVSDADDPNDEYAYREIYRTIFERRYLGRRMECLACHNSEWSVTASADPALDRTWEVPGGLFERGIYGESAGRAKADVQAFFRLKGVLSMEATPEGVGPPFWDLGPGVKPWGLAPECGSFIARGEITSDPLEMRGYFVRDYGETASIWDLEALMRTGFARLRTHGLAPDPNQSQPPGEAAFAWLIAMNLAEKVWEEVLGQRLTIANGFPRNQWQRDVLQDLTQTFVKGGFSLRDVITRVLLHPYFNQGAPATCPDRGSPYGLSALFNPWVKDDDIEERRRNGLGDRVHRHAPRVLIRSAIAALEWTHEQEYFVSEVQEGYRLAGEAAFQRDVGVFLKDSEPGFRGSGFQESLAWEDGYGSCTDLFAPPTADGHDAPADFVDHVAEAASAGHTLEDGLLALADRIVGNPDLSDPAERALMEALVGVPLSTRLLDLAERGEPQLRRGCAAYLASPDFVLEGLETAPKLDVALALIPPGTSSLELCTSLIAPLFASGVATCGQDGTVTLK